MIARYYFIVCVVNKGVLMKKVSDIVADFLVEKQMSDVFLVSGGMIMHLLDSVARNKGLNYYCNYHEQACAVAAEGWARINNRMGVCLVTAGPGAVNALSGICGAYYDSIPIFVVSGQVRSDAIANHDVIRQRGPQEGDVVEMAKPVTKYAVTVKDPESILFHLEKAFHMATSGRPGPVWIEIPLDIQATMVDESRLQRYKANLAADVDSSFNDKMSELEALLSNSKRPLFMVGNGVRLGGACEDFLALAEKMKIPVVSPYTSKDIVHEDFPLFMGTFALAGQRRANFTVQNADLIISLASGLCIPKIGFNIAAFAPKAKKVIVDIDHGQVFHQAIKPDLGIQAHVKDFISELSKRYRPELQPNRSHWLEICAMLKKKYQLITDDYYSDKQFVNSYLFMDKLSEAMSVDDVLVAGAGLDVVSYYQCFKVKNGQRTMTSCNWGSMGWDLPLSIGATIASGRKRVICVTGDGSIQWNVQELLTIAKHRLPILTFVFNNSGYSSIRNSQIALMDGFIAAADEKSGVFVTDFQKLAQAYDLKYEKISDFADLNSKFSEVMKLESGIVEVMINPLQVVSPKSSAFKRPDGTLESRPLDDMAPFLPREEIEEIRRMFGDTN